MGKKNGKVSAPSPMNAISHRIMNAQSAMAHRIQQLYAENKFTQDYVNAQASHGEHRGESMADIFNNIMSDERVERIPAKNDPDITLLKFKNLDVSFGWYVNPSEDREVASYGWIDQAAYDNIKKHVEKKRELEAEQTNEFIDVDDFAYDDDMPPF